MNSTISLFAIAFSVLAFIIANAAIIIVLAQKWSTHKIEWKALDFEPVKEEEEYKEDDDQAFLKSALDLSKKKKKKVEDPLDSILETNNF
jgi:hypothetical protein